MAATTSPTSARRYGVARVCRIWDVPRSSFYADRRRADTTTTPVPAQRRGPKPRVSDDALLAAIRAERVAESLRFGLAFRRGELARRT